MTVSRVTVWRVTYRIGWGHEMHQSNFEALDNHTEKDVRDAIAVRHPGWVVLEVEVKT